MRKCDRTATHNLKPPLSFEPEINDNGYNGHEDHYNGVTQPPVQFRHKFKVHAVYTYNKSEWHKENREYGKHPHYFIGAFGG